jgi:cyclophilin family peptidyl-prolyl cis-trans isomerase/HEAT repeat protein
MHHLLLVSLSLLLMIPIALPAQEEEQNKLKARRRELMEEILRIQDLRTPYDQMLIKSLSDRDPLVRERAALAYGSLQDTLQLGRLLDMLSDPILTVQNAAAFAIGQTAVMLSPAGRETTQENIIWNRIGFTGAAERLIEEMGKFGTGEGMKELLLRFAVTEPPQYPRALAVSLSRFAIRGIITDPGVTYLLRRCRPADQASWEVVYALQMIGDHPLIRQDIENLLQLRFSPDPLVRMNIALLLGKLRDERTSVDPLVRLAEFDGDWRVRINALKSLASFDVNRIHSALVTFRRCIFDGHPLIAVAALSAVGSSNATLRDSIPEAQELRAAIEQVARNENSGFHPQLQAEAALALATLLRREAFKTVAVSTTLDPYLRGQLMKAAGRTGNPSALLFLRSGLHDDDPRVACGALEGLESLARLNPDDSSLTDSCYTLTLGMLASTDVAVVATAASLLGAKPFLRTASVEPLVQKLPLLRVPDDIEAMQEIARTLRSLKDPLALPALQELLKQPDESVAKEAADALAAITGRDFTRQIVRRSEPLYTDYDFKYLAALPPSPMVTIETTRGTIRVELNRSAAPFTVMSFLKLATERGFYRGRTFHRVVPNFVIQGGDPRGDGWGGPGYTIRSELAPLAFETGTLGIASAGKDTEGSQFFITHSPQPHLDGRYTVFGRVVSGQEVVDRILIDDRIQDISIESPGSGTPLPHE